MTLSLTISTSWESNTQRGLWVSKMFLDSRNFNQHGIHIGNLRFSAPSPPPFVDGIQIADRQPHRCIPGNAETSPDYFIRFGPRSLVPKRTGVGSFSEDCLYLKCVGLAMNIFLLTHLESAYILLKVSIQIQSSFLQLYSCMVARKFLSQNRILFSLIAVST